MTEIKTWHERAMEHPDHQNGMVSEGMIRSRMCEEIEELRAQVKVLREAMVLMVTLAPKMEIDLSDPLGVARDIEEIARIVLEAKP